MPAPALKLGEMKPLNLKPLALPKPAEIVITETPKVVESSGPPVGLFPPTGLSMQFNSAEKPVFQASAQAHPKLTVKGLTQQTLSLPVPAPPTPQTTTSVPRVSVGSVDMAKPQVGMNGVLWLAGLTSDHSNVTGISTRGLKMSAPQLKTKVPTGGILNRHSVAAVKPTDGTTFATMSSATESTADERAATAAVTKAEPQEAAKAQEEAEPVKEEEPAKAEEAEKVEEAEKPEEAEKAEEPTKTEEAVAEEETAKAEETAKKGDETETTAATASESPAAVTTAAVAA